ncbi:archaellin/type IV pilin N-terminal domain-containing protein [Methanofollis ethanolicus]|uniref:archaellin/type IV pilin N-terminal domain-containing protein n=1 Tax=Methanofollis ethanolicus TaxID=488124 RepID=UPI00082D7801|nr:archaellin/type IV pilin N-terminal domain-containing protein [Methanofollis ethanolicus]
MRSFKQEEAFTGLEAAIVLIAFVVVAAVFSYVMLGAGFFTSQKSQEVVHSSMAQASSSVEIVGNVVGLGNTTTHDNLTNVLFTISTTAGGSAYDVGDVLMTYTDKGGQYVVNRSPSVDRKTGKITPGVPGAGNWSVEQILNGNDDTLVQRGEQFLINVSIPKSATAVSGDQFGIELKPAVGATLQLKKYVPTQVDNVTLLFE